MCVHARRTTSNNNKAHKASRGKQPEQPTDRIKILILRRKDHNIIISSALRTEVQTDIHSIHRPSVRRRLPFPSLYHHNATTKEQSFRRRGRQGQGRPGRRGQGSIGRRCLGSVSVVLYCCCSICCPCGCERRTLCLSLLLSGEWAGLEMARRRRRAGILASSTRPCCGHYY